MEPGVRKPSPPLRRGVWVAAPEDSKPVPASARGARPVPSERGPRLGMPTRTERGPTSPPSGEAPASVPSPPGRPGSPGSAPDSNGAPPSASGGSPTGGEPMRVRSPDEVVGVEVSIPSSRNGDAGDGPVGAEEPPPERGPPEPGGPPARGPRMSPTFPITKDSLTTRTPSCMGGYSPSRSTSTGLVIPLASRRTRYTALRPSPSSSTRARQDTSGSPTGLSSARTSYWR
ncbi:hypothetical protein COEX109129_38200 [Corallococcus exiguus]